MKKKEENSPYAAWHHIIGEVSHHPILVTRRGPDTGSGVPTQPGALIVSTLGQPTAEPAPPSMIPGALPRPGSITTIAREKQARSGPSE